MDLSVSYGAVPKYAEATVAFGGSYGADSALLISALSGVDAPELMDVAVGDFTTGVDRDVVRASIPTSVPATGSSYNGAVVQSYHRLGVVFDLGVSTEITAAQFSSVVDFVSGSLVVPDYFGTPMAQTTVSELSVLSTLYGSHDGATWVQIGLPVSGSGSKIATTKTGAGGVSSVITVSPPETASDSNLSRHTVSFVLTSETYRYFGVHVRSRNYFSFLNTSGIGIGSSMLPSQTWSVSLSDLRLTVVPPVPTAECDCTWTRDDGPTGAYTRDVGAAGTWSRRRC